MAVEIENDVKKQNNTRLSKEVQTMNKVCRDETQNNKFEKEADHNACALLHLHT